MLTLKSTKNKKRRKKHCRFGSQPEVKEQKSRPDSKRPLFLVLSQVLYTVSSSCYYSFVENHPWFVIQKPHTSYLWTLFTLRRIPEFIRTGSNIHIRETLFRGGGPWQILIMVSNGSQFLVSVSNFQKGFFIF